MSEWYRKFPDGVVRGYCNCDWTGPERLDEDQAEEDYLEHLYREGCPPAFSTTASDLLDEYGSAIRHFWGGLDGRGVRDSLRELAGVVRRSGDATLPPSEVKRLRAYLSICQNGGGHWDDECDDECRDAE